jgi:kumamolisin
MMTIHCLKDDCTDNVTCPCPCEECFFAREQAGSLIRTMLKHNYLRHHPRLRGVRQVQPTPAPGAEPGTVAVRASFPAGSLSPAQILTAYGFKQNQYAGAAPVKLGIGSLGGGVVQADIDNSVAAWGMKAPNLTVRTVGGAKNDPSDQDANVENMLDLVPTMAFTWWWLTGTAADITISFGPNASGGMELVTRDLVAAGCEVCSWSWGSAAASWDPSERASLTKAFADAVAAGVCFCAASGDNSIDDGTTSPSADYPCSDPNVWAVGGTRVIIDSSGARTDEEAWGDGNPGDEGGGGGYDPTVPIPSWQKGVVPSNATGRGVPDTAANADPNSGWQMSANGSWTVVGGTSASSPFTAALIAVAKGVAKAAGSGVTALAAYFAAATACNDIINGSDGSPATPGWDPATGLGSPNGAGFINAVVSWATGAAATPPPPVPPGAPGTVPTLAQALAWAAQGIQAGDPLQRQSDAIAAATAGLTAGWPK